MMTCPFCHSRNMQQYALHCVVLCLDCGALFYDNALDCAHSDTHPIHPNTRSPEPAEEFMSRSKKRWMTN